MAIFSSPAGSDKVASCKRDITTVRYVYLLLCIGLLQLQCILLLAFFKLSLFHLHQSLHPVQAGSVIHIYILVDVLLVVVRLFVLEHALVQSRVTFVQFCSQLLIFIFL